jgi:hypothetical protein
MTEILKASLPTLLAVMVPTLMVLVGILLNKSDINRIDAQMTKLNEKMDGLATDLRSEMADLSTSLRSEMADLSTSLRSEMGDLSTNLRSEMAQMRNSFHSDILMLVQRDGDKDTRIALLEERSKSN